MIDLYRIARPLLFALPPETAHSVSLAALKCAFTLGLLAPFVKGHATPVNLMGLNFPNRLGLAAGLDKSAKCIDSLGALGFGFIEVGTITPKSQLGNSRPRLFRLKDDRALINRMGFPNDGVAAVSRRLIRRSYTGICGVSIGKNAITPLHDAVSDYISCLMAVYSQADYVAINISSPNTNELRRLQHGELLRSLLSTLVDTRAALTRQHGRHVPLLIKFTADLDDTDLADSARLSVACGIDGIIATNTTVRRDGLKDLNRGEDGGLSGAPLLSHALRAVQCIRAEVGTNVPIIGVGGIQTAADAMAMRRAGADLLQCYTGFVYRGPALMQEIIASDADR